MKYILRDSTIADRAIAEIRKLPKGKVYQVEIKEYRKRRSLAQNALLHRWMTEIADKYEDHYGERHSPAAWKEYFKQLFLGTQVTEIRGQQVERTRPTRNMPVVEMTDFLQRIDHYCVSELGLMLTHPEDIYYEAMHGNERKRA